MSTNDRREGMRRKLIRQGVGGCTIYVPKRWVEQHRLAPGAEISIDTSGDQLILSPGTGRPLQEATIALVNLSESSIRTLITNAYRSGYDRVRVTYENEQQERILRDVVRTRLIGFEITGREKGALIVENITEPAAEQFGTILRKYCFSIDEQFALVAQALAGKKADDLEQLQETIQKYDNFCRRVIAKERLLTPRPEMLWAFLSHLLHAERSLYHLVRSLQRTPHLVAYLEEIRALWQLVRDAYLKTTVEPLARVHERHAELEKHGLALLAKAKGPEAVALHWLLSSEREFYLANSPLAGYLL